MDSFIYSHLISFKFFIYLFIFQCSVVHFDFLHTSSFFIYNWMNFFMQFWSHNTKVLYTKPLFHSWFPHACHQKKFDFEAVDISHFFNFLTQEGNSCFLIVRKWLMLTTTTFFVLDGWRWLKCGQCVVSVTVVCGLLRNRVLVERWVSYGVI